ncbi:transmembrane protein 80 isoform X1 [Anolis carolinensis]|uniref:transmembrane protein 80 isoform X1 n=1 Tax=Anolis carolinensis TaxID=28377 RepID=UPI002F2B35C2
MSPEWFRGGAESDEAARSVPREQQRTEKTPRRLRKDCRETGWGGAGIEREGPKWRLSSEEEHHLLLLFIMALLETIRLYFGTKGNLTEDEAPLGFSLVITAGCVILSVYFLALQTYVLKADVIINVVLLVIYGLEGILQIIAIAAFVS